MKKLHITVPGPELNLLCRSVSMIGKERLETLCKKSEVSFAQAFHEQQYKDLNFVTKDIWVEWHNTCEDVFLTSGLVWEQIVYDDIQIEVSDLEDDPDDFYEKEYEDDAEFCEEYWTLPSVLAHPFQLENIKMDSRTIKRPKVAKGNVHIVYLHKSGKNIDPRYTP